MDQSPKFTIIIPVYNRAELVVRTLESVDAQTLRPLRLIIVDNNSTDNTREVVDRWADTHRSADFMIDILSETKPGACAARNRGLAEVMTPYVVFFDSDDTMDPGLLAAYDKAFADNPDAQIVCTRARQHLLDGSTRLSHAPGRSPIRTHIYHALLRTQGYAVSTDYLRQCGTWNEALPCWNDWELGIRLLLSDPVIAYVPEIFVDIYSQAESITGRSFSRRSVDLERALDAASDSISASDRLDRDSLLRLIDYRRVNLAANYRRESARDKAARLYANAMSHPLNTPAKILFPLFYYLSSILRRGTARIVNPFI